MSNINKEELMRGLSDSQVNKSKQDFGTNALQKKRQNHCGRCSSEHLMTFGSKYYVQHWS